MTIKFPYICMILMVFPFLYSRSKNQGNLYVPRHISISELLAWLPPSFGTVILNFDTVVQHNGAGAVFIFRDADGTRLLAHGMSLPPFTVPFTELLVAWAGLKAENKLFKHKEPVVQGDSITVIYSLD